MKWKTRDKPRSNKKVWNS